MNADDRTWGHGHAVALGSLTPPHTPPLCQARPKFSWKLWVHWGQPWFHLGTLHAWGHWWLRQRLELEAAVGTYLDMQP